MCYFIFWVWHLDNVLIGDAVGVVEETVDGVGDGSHTDGDTESENVDCCGTDEMVLCIDEIVSCVSDQVGLESETERNIQGNVGTSS